VASREFDLGKGELEVLRALWEVGPANVRAVLNEMHRRGRRVAYTTVQTVLGRLEQKGVVASDKSGLAYVYRAKVSRERLSRSRLKSLVDQLYDGAVGDLVLQLVRSKRLTSDELDELQKLIDRLDTDRD